MGLINKLGHVLVAGISGLVMVPTGNYNYAQENQGKSESPVIQVPGLIQLENKVESEETFLHKVDPSFQDFKKVLGKSYDSLPDAKKKDVETRWGEGKGCIGKLDCEDIFGIYGMPLKDPYLTEGEIQKIRKFRVNGLPEEKIKGYLETYPWIRREDLKDIDDPKKPLSRHKVLIHFSEFYEDYDIDLDFKDLKFPSFFNPFF